MLIQPSEDWLCWQSSGSEGVMPVPDIKAVPHCSHPLSVGMSLRRLPEPLCDLKLCGSERVFIDPVHCFAVLAD